VTGRGVEPRPHSNAVRALPAVSVLMPTYGHAPYIARAIESVVAQSLESWELIIVDDASPDDTVRVVVPWLVDPRIRHVALQRNVGLGAALNHAMDLARAPLVAYLPSDDVYHRNHLASLADALRRNANAVLAYSGIRYRYNRESRGRIEGAPLQLVQVMHRAVDERWTERSELVTDDLAVMFWAKLGDEATSSGPGR
jgi:glycosyltransferase involved in cell wall biosynthesis